MHDKYYKYQLQYWIHIVTDSFHRQVTFFPEPHFFSLSLPSPLQLQFSRQSSSSATIDFSIAAIVLLRFLWTDPSHAWDVVTCLSFFSFNFPSHRISSLLQPLSSLHTLSFTFPFPHLFRLSRAVLSFYTNLVIPTFLPSPTSFRVRPLLICWSRS